MQHLFDLYGWEVNMYDTIQQGLINRTYSVQTTKGEFILQSINHNVFKNPKAIDANINAIGNYIKQTNPDYLYTHLIPLLQGNTLIEWEGGYYRAFNKIEGYALSIRQDFVNPDLLFLGTEFGLYITVDGGKNWSKFENNMPAVAVMHLDLHKEVLTCLHNYVLI